MVSVGVRDLKNRLSEFLQLVKRGETIIVTQHHKIIAQLSKPDKLDSTLDLSESEALLRLSKDGTLTFNSGILKSAHDPLLLKPADGESTQDYLDKIRAERI